MEWLQYQSGVDVAQQGYRRAAKLYDTVYARLNPGAPEPELLPSVSMAIASTELAAALDGSVCGGSFLRKTFHNFATVAEATVQAKAEADAEVQYCLESDEAARTVRITGLLDRGATADPYAPDCGSQFGIQHPAISMLKSLD